MLMFKSDLAEMANMRNRRMDDPDGVNSRIFVGNIPLDTDRETLKKKFETHGQVNGVMVLKGFAFLQFDKDIQARQAIEKENGSEFNGRKLDVKPAKNNNNRGMAGGSGGGPSPWVDQGGGQQHLQQQSQQQQHFRGGGGGFGRGGRGGGDHGQRGRGGQRGGFNSNNRGGNYGGNNRGGFNGPGHSVAPWGGEDYGNDEYNDYHDQQDEMGDMERFNERLQEEHEDMGYGGHGGYDGGHRGGGGFNQARGRGGNNFRGRGGVWSNRGGGILGGPPPQQHGPPPTSEKPNDVEIICMDKSLRVYGENLEGRLKNMSLAVDILFPNPDIPVGKVLGNIASRGVMFAICLTLDNRDHGSVTLNVLQGQQQEHRNMPVDDAMSFISKQFPSLVGGSGGGNSVISREGSALPGISHSGHPQDILKILSFLTDDRPLSIMEYDKMIKYLVTKRTDTLKEEYGDNIPAHLQHPPVGPQQDPATKAKQEEIQNRIQKILKEKKTSNGSKPSSGAMAPSLQAAIDSLVKNGPNLLSSVSQPHSSHMSASSSYTMPGSSYHGYQTQAHDQDFTGGSGGFGAGFGNY